MSKQKRSGSAPAVVQQLTKPKEEVLVVLEVESKQPPAAAKESVYSFETKPKCPRCKGTDSRCYATKNGVQYRQCRLVVCGVKFSVKGKEVV